MLNIAWGGADEGWGLEMNNLSGIDVAIITVGGTLLVCAIVVYVVMRRIRGSAYEGVIESKGTRDNDDSTSYFLVVKLDSGATKRVYLSQKLWSEWQVGQRVVKQAGQLNPQLA